ncbi:MAG: LemA family protein [Candidatus Thiodiazotropha sp.]
MKTAVVLILLALLFWAVFIYNRLVRDRNRVLAAWSDIDVQLKRRHDLIPKLVEAVRQYAAYEQSTLSALTQLRSESRQVSEVDRMEQAIGVGVQRLLAVAEAYPELQANENFLALQREVSEVENQIQYARRYYNGAVRALNIRIDSFPDLILARLFGYRHAAYFVMEDRS